MENKSNSQTSTAEELMNFVRMILSEEWIAKISGAPYLSVMAHIRAEVA